MFQNNTCYKLKKRFQGGANVINNNYYDIAFSDLGYLQSSINSGYFNAMIVLCQQISEKALKSVAELCITDDKIFKSHNLKQINSAIYDKGIDLRLDDAELAYVKDFYYCAKEPGDNFVEVQDYEFVKSLRVMYKVLNAVNKFRLEKNLYVKIFNKKYPDNYTMKIIK